VVLQSFATNLVANDTNGVYDVFVRGPVWSPEPVGSVTFSNAGALALPLAGVGLAPGIMALGGAAWYVRRRRWDKLAICPSADASVPNFQTQALHRRDQLGLINVLDPHRQQIGAGILSTPAGQGRQPLTAHG